MQQNKPLLKITWRDIAGIDSADNSSSWFDTDQIFKQAKSLYDHKYTSIGYLVHNTNEFIVLAATKDSGIGDGVLWSDASMIMKSVIINSEELLTSKEFKL